MGTGLFLIAYLGASFLDLWTTEIALLAPRAREGNPAATTDGLYSATKAWLVTTAGGIVLGYMVIFSLQRAHLVPDRWLRHPVKALLRPTLFPWMDRDKGRTALNCLSYALAFPLLRVAAAANNAMIGYGMEGFISYAVMKLAVFVPVLTATIAVILAMYALLVILMAPVAKRAIALLAGSNPPASSSVEIT